MKEVDRGYIALFRQFIEWEWYDDANTMRLFIHCLLLANYKDKKWRGKTIKRGQFITSQPKLANSLKLSIMQIRNSLNKLKTTGEITVSTTADYSIITVKNYNLYQENNRQDNSRVSKKQQSENSLITTTNKDNKEIRNKDNNTHTNNIEKEKKSVCDFSEISEEDLTLLTNYAKKSKVRNLQAYIHTLIKNGGYKSIIEAEKKTIKKESKKREDKANEIKENFKKVNSKYKAAIFIGMYGDFTDENHPEEVKQLMEEYNIPSFTEAVRYGHEHKD